jgi:hypothetical protein
MMGEQAVSVEELEAQVRAAGMPSTEVPAAARVLWLRFFQGKQTSRRAVAEQLNLTQERIAAIETTANIRYLLHSEDWRTFVRQRVPGGHPYRRTIFGDDGLFWLGLRPCPHCDGTGYAPNVDGEAP